MRTTEQQPLWGGETEKAVNNFPISGESIPVPVIRWLGAIKGAAARVNAELGLLDQVWRSGSPPPPIVSPPVSSMTSSRSTS
ncbi:MAG: hypothetical protein ACRDKL_12430, partial [Solirubrobacteraceae bacterium]